MLKTIKRLFSSRHRREQVREQLEKLRKQTPVPIFWLFGKTQSGKTSIIKYLTGASEAEIGHGFKPCTRFSRAYEFPTPDAPLVKFLDTRGLDEPEYDPAEDLARFNTEAHVVLVTVKVLDHAQANVLRHLRTVRQAQSHRPVVLALTCLHEAYPQQQHPQPYPFRGQGSEVRGQGSGVRGQGSGVRSQGSEQDKAPQNAAGPGQDHQLSVPPQPPAGRCPEELQRSLSEQARRFQDLVDVVVPIDLTRPEEGFDEPSYGGEQFKQALLDCLPRAYRQTLLTLGEATSGLQELYARHALPHIVGYSSLAATAGAIPIPWLDLLILPAIQTQMIYHLARFYGRPLTAGRFMELASTLGLGIVLRQAAREVVKFIPYVGSVAGGALAGASTFALGKAFCYYYSAVHKGHVPSPEDLKTYYREQLALAERFWGKERAP